MVASEGFIGGAGSHGGGKPKLRAIYFAPLLAVLALLGWAFASPVGASPDDDFHLVSTWCGGTSDRCEETGEQSVRTVPAALRDVTCFATWEDTSAKCQDGIDFDPGRTVETARGNFNQEYPPVYYAVMGLLAGDNLVASALSMRVLSVLLFVGLTTAVYALVSAGRRQMLTLMWLVSTVPMGAFLIASNNPSGWSVIGVGTALVALLGYLDSDGRRRWALGAIFALAAVLAAGSRGDAALYMLMTIGAVFLLSVPALRAERTPERIKDYASAAILPAIVAVVCVLLFLSSRQAAVGVSGFGPPVGSPSLNGEDLVPLDPVKNGLNLAASNLLNLPFLWAGNFGEWGLGWLDTPMPSIVTFASVAAVSVVVFLGLGRLWGRKLLVVAVVGAAMVVVPLFVLQQGGNVVGEQVQPRYVLPIIVLFVGVALLNRPGVSMPISRAQLTLLWVGLNAAFLVSLHTNIRRYVTGNDVRSFNLDAKAEWWWDIAISPNGVWIAASVAYALLVAILLREMHRAHGKIAA